MEGQFAVLSPWADADAKSLKGITPRLPTLKGKTIGMFCTVKPMAKPMLDAVEKGLNELSEKPTISWYYEHGISSPEMETEHKGKFADWLKGVDAVVGAVGD
jgi:hypothetical protein